MKTFPIVALMGLSMAAAAQSPSRPDQAFFEQAAQGGMAEVDAGKLAQSKGASEAVREFGAMMIKDHTQANDKLKKMAAAKNVRLPADLNAEHKAMKRELQSLSGEAFDAAYIRGQIKDHEVTVGLFKREVASGEDPDAKAFASETLPTIERHLAMVQKMANMTDREKQSP